MNKKIIILIVLVVVILSVILLVIFLSQRNNPTPLAEDKQTPAQFKVEFLNTEEKEALNISPELRIQVLQRGPNGEALVYRVIENEDEVVSDISEVKTISPNQVTEQ